MESLSKPSVRSYIHDRILGGFLETGDRISLPQVARKLGISVTPVRETLAQLSSSGLVHYQSNQGFMLQDLSIGEAQILHHTVVALESEALLQAKPGQLNLAKLRTINEAFGLATTAEQRFRKDMEFHEELTIFYAGTAIAQLLEDLKVRIYLYERAYLENATNVFNSVNLHKRIIHALGDGNRTEAIGLLRQNWLNIEPMLRAAGLTID